MARQMKDSGSEWSGSIPADWKLIPFRYVLKERQEKNSPIKSTERLSLSIDLGVTLYSEKTTNLDRFKEDFEQYKLAHSGDLVMNSMNMIVGATGVSAYYGCVSPVYYTFYDEQEDHCTAKFCEYIFKSKPMLRYLFSIGKGIYAIARGDDRVNTCRLKVSKEDLKSIIIPVPSIIEQRKIISFLDKHCAEIDAVIAKTSATIEEYKKLKQSIIIDAVTKGIRGGRPVKDSGIEWIGNIPSDWDIKVAFQLFKQIKNKNEGLAEQNLLSLSYGKIKRRSIDAVGGLLPESFDGYNIIEKDDIVLRLTDLQNDQTSLRVGLSNERGIVTSAYLTLRNQSANTPLYLYYYLHSFDLCKGFYGMGAGVRQGLNWDGLKLLKFALPSVEEQMEITGYLEKKCSEIDVLIEKKTALLAELESYKKSVIYEYVTGKKEVVQ